MGLQGIAHIGITVTDLSRSKEWYSQVVGWKPEMDGGGEGVSFSLGALPSGQLLGLRQYEDGSGDAFDFRRTGLDHLAFAVQSSELPDWERRFSELGVTFTPTHHDPFGHFLNFKDPDGIALELYAPPDESE